MNNYNQQLADEIKKNIERFLATHPQAEALSSGYLTGGKRVREHPQAGFTSYSQDPATLVASHGNLMLNTFNEDNDDTNLNGSGRNPRLTNAIKQRILKEHPELMQVHLSGGAINWKKIWDGIKKGASIVSKAAPIVSSLAPEEYRETINKTGDISNKISGMGRISGAGFWKDFGDGFVKGIKGSTKVASKVLPIVTAFAPEIAPLTGAVMATNAIINKGSGRKGRPRKIVGGDLYPPAVEGVVEGGKMSKHRTKSVGHAKNQARGALIRQFMREKGLTLPQASSYIKQHNIQF
jgi:hypothetical protein